MKVNIKGMKVECIKIGFMYKCPFCNRLNLIAN